MPILFAVEAIVFSALYLICLFITGLLWGHHGVVLLALMAMGTTYLGGLTGFLYNNSPFPRSGGLLLVQRILVTFSIVIAIAAGISLLAS